MSNNPHPQVILKILDDVYEISGLLQDLSKGALPPGTFSSIGLSKPSFIPSFQNLLHTLQFILNLFQGPVLQMLPRYEMNNDH